VRLQEASNIDHRRPPSHRTQRLHPQPVRIPPIPTIASASKPKLCDIKSRSPALDTPKKIANRTSPPHRQLRTTHQTHQQPQTWERFTDLSLVPERSSLRVSPGSRWNHEERLLTTCSPQGKHAHPDTPPQPTHHTTLIEPRNENNGPYAEDDLMIPDTF
jgi:hypothetical protein